MGKLFKKTIIGFFALILLISFINNVYAITGSIGNARMVLRVDYGDKIEKSILVKNVNDVSVNIELTALGDLVDYISIKDSKFTLSPGEEKKAFFIIEAAKSGTTESKINVKFSPVNGGNGVGLTSTIIVIANGGEEESEGSSFFDWFKNKESDGNNDNEGVSVGVNKQPDNENTIEKNEKSFNNIFNPIIILAVLPIILFVALLILLSIAKNRIRKTNKLNQKNQRQTQLKQKLNQKKSFSK